MGSGHLQVNGELDAFAGKVPTDVADASSFSTGSLARTMTGIRSAAIKHAEHVHNAETWVTQAQDGMDAYRQGARTIQNNYDTTDADNGNRLRDISNDTMGTLLRNPGTRYMTTGTLPDPADRTPTTVPTLPNGTPSIPTILPAGPGSVDDSLPDDPPVVAAPNDDTDNTTMPTDGL